MPEAGRIDGPTGPSLVFRGAPERRCATATLVAALTSGLAAVREPRLVRERFEEELRALLCASSVTFREDGEPIDRPYVVSYEVPVAPVDGRPCLEAVFDPSRPADDRARADARRRRAGRRAADRDRARERTVAASCAGPRGRGGAAHRIQRGDSRRARSDREGRGHRLHGPDRGRKRHRARSSSRVRFTSSVAGGRRPSSPSTAPPLSRRCSRRSSSASRTGRRPACAGGAGSSSTRTKARCFSTRCRTCRRPRRPSCCARFRICRWSGSADTARGASTPASSWRRTARCADLVEQRRFRLDLFYRLNGVEVQVPPLRCRRDDILELARYFLDRHRTFRPLALSTAAADALLTYDWPGNVRELERVVERAVALAGGSLLELDDLPPALLGGYADALAARPPRPIDDAGVGQPVRAAGARAVREQQAEDLPRAADFLPHAGRRTCAPTSESPCAGGCGGWGRAGTWSRVTRGVELLGIVQWGHNVISASPIFTTKWSTSIPS